MFELAMVNEPSVFELLRFDCIIKFDLDPNVIILGFGGDLNGCVR